jgi:hypothetical protein
MEKTKQNLFFNWFFNVQIPYPALIWFQQEKTIIFLNDHVFVAKKRDLNPKIEDYQCSIPDIILRLFNTNIY